MNTYIVVIHIHIGKKMHIHISYMHNRRVEKHKDICIFCRCSHGIL